VEQIGVLGECMDSGLADYQPWYESYPPPLVPIDEDRLLIGSGDRITATVVALPDDRFRMVLVDNTTHLSFTTVQTVAGVGDTDAAILIEAPHRQGYSLASFTPIHFSSCEVDGRPITAFSPRGSDIIIGGVAKTATSDLSEAGDGFTVSSQP
jgi:hypothetical protein